MKKILLSLIVSFFIVSYQNDLSAQSYSKDQKFELDLGLGFPDLLHLGMKYRFTKLSKIGMSYGTALFINNNRQTSAVTLEHVYHFGKSHENSKMPIYYFTQKLTYLNDIKTDLTANIMYFTPSIGKAFYSEGPLGINLDVGLNFRVYQNLKTDITADARTYEQFPAVFPALRLQFFFNL